MKKTISFLMAIALTILIIPFGKFNANATEFENTSLEEVELENKNNYNKIHFYLNKEEHTTIDDKSELTEAVMSFTSNDSKLCTAEAEKIEAKEENIQITVEFDSDFMDTDLYKAFSEEREQIKDSEDVLDFRKRLNAYSEKYHKELLNKNIDILDAFDYISIEEIKYSPFVVMEVKPSAIKEEKLQMLCNSEEVENISIGCEPNIENEATWTQTLSRIGAYNIVHNENYTGQGVRIGIYETAICEVDHPNLVGKDITVNGSNAGVEISGIAHANNVTSIIAIIAPEAEIFVSNDSSARLSWFIDNYCDVVNQSTGAYYNISNGDGTYSEGRFEYRYDYDAIYDYQIQAHFFTVCKSAGNVNTDNTKSSYNPNGRITSPGYAYNVITVGGADLKNVGSETHWMHADSASYISGALVKPNVSAPFNIDIPNIGNGRGTSYATPLVTASVALLIDSSSSYSMYPERIMSVLTSTAQKTYDYDYIGMGVGNFNKKVGAGIINVEAAIESNLYYLTGNTNTEAQTEIASREIYLLPGDEIQIALSWLVTSDYENEMVYVTDYDLKLFGPSGNLIVASAVSNSNTEMIRFTMYEEGIYRIVIYQYSAMDPYIEKDWMALTYNVDYA